MPFGAIPIPYCTDAEVVGACAGDSFGGGHYNTENFFDAERYADVDSNPYVFGSAAFNLAHGLPAPLPLVDRQREYPAGESQQAVSNQQSAVGSQQSAVNSQSAAQSWLPIALIIAAVVLWK